MNSSGTPEPLRASFRDPSGQLFTRDGALYRQVNQAYRPHYEHLIQSGLYQALVDKGWLIPHEEVQVSPLQPELAWKVIRPQPIAFISYPYEWCFSQYKDAALLTLNIQKVALDHNMWLKDSSAYNIQFHDGHPVLIDSLSFEIYPQGQPWVAYRQFCQHFLAPLSLMAQRNVRMGQWMRVGLDGVPLDLASQLLPWRTRFWLPLLLHIHLHAASQKRYASQPPPVNRRMEKAALLGLIDTLEAGIRRLSWSPSSTDWSRYYQESNYTVSALEHKQALVAEFLDVIRPSSVWDLGANTGLFSRLASRRGAFTVAFDLDYGAVEQNYLQCKREGETRLLPLVLDLTNPSPALGWAHQERLSWLQRGPVEAVLALALIHHLAISNNLPLPLLADFFHSLGRWLVIEFVPKSDSQVQRLLSFRVDIFPNYTRAGFESAFGARYHIHRIEAIRDSERVLYLMEAR